MTEIRKINNIRLTSLHDTRPFIVDATYKADGTAKPVLIFVHGFKGFKDWGQFNLLASYFAHAGFVCIKPNLSHNGTTPEYPTEFTDLEAFGRNNFSIELDDLHVLIDYLLSRDRVIPDTEVNLDKLYIMGHSRGGGLVILKAREDARIKAVVTWAGISNLHVSWSFLMMDEWKRNGVQWVMNYRTGQRMPLYYQLCEDVMNNRQRFDIPQATAELQQPLLIIHGDADESLPVSMAHELKAQKTNAELLIIPTCNHAFGGIHPYPSEILPKDSVIAADHTIKFLKSLG